MAVLPSWRVKIYSPPSLQSEVRRRLLPVVGQSPCPAAGVAGVVVVALVLVPGFDTHTRVMERKAFGVESVLSLLCDKPHASPLLLSLHSSWLPLARVRSYCLAFDNANLVVDLKLLVPACHLAPLCLAALPCL